ncbi:MFS transporter [Longirhabdus pacifica]|uniref:MFS transporter n=1 Tax=Longirhabdus pacifica TaxID=2305227 RepID=UPI001008E860|nr:MFS transporter [Longirhabdus pacifica]
MNTNDAQVSLQKNKPFIILMTAQLISSIGDWLSLIAIISMVGLKWNAAPMEIAFIYLCLAFPMVSFGPLAGTFADRLNRKVLMIASDVGRAGLILLLIIADSMAIVYVCLFLIGTLSAVFIPAKNGKLKELVPHQQMKSAMAITSMIDSSTKILGPLLSGLLVSTFGATTVFLLDSMTFIVSAIFIGFVPKTYSMLKKEHTHNNENQQLNPQHKISFKKDFLEGLSFLKRNTYLLFGMLYLGISLFILQLIDSQIIVLIRELSNPSPELFGYIVSAVGVGMFITGFILSKKTTYNTIFLMMVGVCGMGVAFAILTLLTYLDTASAIIWGPSIGLLAGFASALVFIPFQASVQMETPVHMTGRVFGVLTSIMNTATILGPLAGGMLVVIVGIIPAFTITSILLIAISTIGFVLKGNIERRKIDVSKSERSTQGAAPS